jgi:predicted kinase
MNVTALLQSGLFWTIVGTLAAIMGTYVAFRQYRQSRTAIQGAHTDTPGLSTAVELGSAVEELDTEHDWVAAQVEAINGARGTVSLCLHTLHSSSESWKAKLVNAALADAKKRSVEIRVLAAANPEKLSGAYELVADLGIELRFAEEIKHYDLRFLKADSGVAVLGVAAPDLKEGKYRASHSWAVLRSISLCEALERDFQRMWLSFNSVPFARYSAETIRRLGSVPSTKLAADLGLDYQVVQELATQGSMADLSKGYVLVFHGKSCSGKSSLMLRLEWDYGARCLDLRDLCLPHIDRYGMDQIKGPVLSNIYKEMLAIFESNEYDAVEVRPEHSDVILPKVFDIVAKKNLHPLLIHCNVSVNSATTRNFRRAKQVPVEIILDQAEWESRNTFRSICDSAGVDVIEIAGDHPADDCFCQLKASLNTHRGGQ